MRGVSGMEFKIEDIDKVINTDVKRENNTIIFNIDNREHKLNVIRYDGKRAEFMLNNKYHSVRYIEVTPTAIKIQLVGDHNIITINKFPALQSIVKRSTTAIVDTQKILQSPIPGRVISIAVKPETSVKKGDVIAVLESMKMQVAIKAHKDGIVKEIRIKEGSTITRNSPVALIE